MRTINSDVKQFMYNAHNKPKTDYNSPPLMHVEDSERISDYITVCYTYSIPRWHDVSYVEYKNHAHTINLLHKYLKKKKSATSLSTQVISNYY